MIRIVTFSIALSIGLSLGVAYCQDGEGKKPELPKSGVLSRSLTTGYQSTNVDMPWNEKNAALTQQAPVTGSVSRISPREWRMRVFNNSQDTYSVNLRVRQLSNSGAQLRSDSFSYTLKGGESAERALAAAFNSEDAILVLDSWRNLTPKKKETQATPTAIPAMPGRKTK